MNLNELAKSIRFDNASKGFDPLEGGLDRYLLLTISEVCEAQDEVRDGKDLVAIYHKDMVQLPWHGGASLAKFPKDEKPEGFPVEIADAAIRIMDIQAKLELDIKLLNGEYKFDVSKELDTELLAIANLISCCSGQPSISQAVSLNTALSGLFQIANNCGFNMLAVIELKLAYNRTRPPKHGRKF